MWNLGRATVNVIIFIALPRVITVMRHILIL
jgi:hypothetical protein